MNDAHTRLMNALQAWCVVIGLATGRLLMMPAQAAEPPLVLEQIIRLPGVSGRIDLLAIDLPRKRLIVAELGNNTVDIIDVGAGARVYQITGLREPQGVGYAERAEVILIANAGDGTVRLISANDFSVRSTIPLGNDADNVRIDPRNGIAVIGYGDGGLALIDPLARTKVGDIRLPAHPEGFQIDPSTGRTYVNVPDAHQICVVDLDARAVVASWPTKEARSNFPIALDPSEPLIASVFRSPPRLALLDPVTGRERQRLASCGDADDVFFDRQRARIYISCGAGQVAVLEHKTAEWSTTGTIATAAGADIAVRCRARSSVRRSACRHAELRSGDPRISAVVMMDASGDPTHGLGVLVRMVCCEPISRVRVGPSDRGLGPSAPQQGRARRTERWLARAGVQFTGPIRSAGR
jgi:DNA-binding beta-propeller fold protein YncE